MKRESFYGDDFFSIYLMFGRRLDDLTIPEQNDAEFFIFVSFSFLLFLFLIIFF